MSLSRSRCIRLALTALILLSFSVPLSAFAQSAQTYTVQPGDSLYRIAQQFNTDVTTLARLNNIANSWRIYTGQVLTLPDGPPTEAVLPLDEAGLEAAQTVAYSAGTPLYHTVQPGETMAGIAALYGVTADQIAAMNALANASLIFSGQQLLVGMTLNGAAAPLSAAPALEEVLAGQDTASTASAETRYTVRPGEYLSQIAARFGVPWTSIAAANNIYNPDTIVAGQTLIIPGSASGTVETAAGDLMTTFSLDVPSAAPPAPSGIGREVLVDLSDSRVYAYENGVLVRNVLVSTGLPATPTVQGDFTVQRKYVSQTMSGPGYYLPGVPYIMYFYAGYALHGTYWHENWGQQMSHGCVNMPTPEAEWFYNFTEIGTPVRVQA